MDDILIHCALRAKDGHGGESAGYESPCAGVAPGRKEEYPSLPLGKLRRGVSIATDDGRRVRTAPAKIQVIKEANNPWYEITLIEGRNRQIRRMFEQVGHHVEKIKRVRFGPLQLDVPPGKYRQLKPLEVAKLRASAR